MNRLEQLEAEYRGADDLLLHMVSFEVRRRAGRPHFDSSSQEVGLAAAVAIMQAWHRVIQWQACDGSPGALVAREVVAEAVAAEALRPRFPPVAAQLERPWRTAVRARGRLRDLSGDAEVVALRLLPTWRLPLEELPVVAVALAAAESRPSPV